MSKVNVRQAARSFGSGSFTANGTTLASLAVLVFLATLFLVHYDLLFAMLSSTWLKEKCQSQKMHRSNSDRQTYARPFMNGNDSLVYLE